MKRSVLYCLEYRNGPKVHRKPSFLHEPAATKAAKDAITDGAQSVTMTKYVHHQSERFIMTRDALFWKAIK